MALQYLIGLGGTGSKIVESFLHLAACGLGPKEVRIMMVDADESNGNLSRTMDLLRLYNKLHAYFRRQGQETKCPLFHTNVITEKNENKPFNPVDDPDTKLEKYLSINIMGAEKHIWRSLYSEEELGQKLTNGFRGRPSLGAPAFLRSVNDSEKIWQYLLKHARVKDMSGEVHVMLCGSIFGGTGAAGIPNLARIIRKKYTSENGAGLKMGACLLSPYFQYDTREIEGLKAEPSSFMANSSSALGYYKSLQKDGGGEHALFDAFYVIGWPSMFFLPHPSPGDAMQKNPPLFPEMLAGLAACRFFGNLPRARSHSAVALWGGDKVKWENLPGINDSGHKGVHEYVISALRTAYAYVAKYGPVLTEADKYPTLKRQPWYYHLFLKNRCDLKVATDARDAVKNLEEYFKILLRWFLTMADFYPDIDLVNRKVLAPSKDSGGKTKFNDEDRMVELDIDNPSSHKHFAQMDAKARGRSLAQVYSRLQLMRPPGGDTVAPFLDALYACCRLRFTQGKKHEAQHQAPA